ncbi:hypothetical protein E1295_37685 [Nonomuraea mesophila]|uniref:Uncharacterized protein n=1 Tax=Nonomuraea mesophila TaxID=2530382 RepID=A0A4R5EHX4_9ACTN|nr:S-4TM family putative pore-forming effector [Nonomuraea mesophila]TDE33902.1 hypothetical protein E1295_37685 [Nonomuraea mesophila]
MQLKYPHRKIPSVSTSSPFTAPAIAEAQNKSKYLRMLAAQRQLYSDSKKIYSARIILLVGGTIVAPTAALIVSDWRAAVGGTFTIVLILIYLIGSVKEKRLNREAAAIQEQFDTSIYQISWNELLADRPTPTLIADAARRYKGPSTLQDWYPDASDVHRPLDILICQRSNLGWGISLHKAWARLTLWVLLAIICAAMLIGILGEFAIGDFLIAVLVPLGPLIREAIEMFRAHTDSAQEKAGAEQKVMALWRKGMVSPGAITDVDCRGIQDCIYLIRRSNAVMPNWFNDRRRNFKEVEMRLSAEDLIAEAREHGQAR